MVAVGGIGTLLMQLPSLAVVVIAELIPAHSGVSIAVHIHSMVGDHGLVEPKIPVLQPEHQPSGQGLQLGRLHGLVDAPSAVSGANFRIERGNIDGISLFEGGVFHVVPIHIKLPDFNLIVTTKKVVMCKSEVVWRALRRHFTIVIRGHHAPGFRTLGEVKQNHPGIRITLEHGIALKSSSRHAVVVAKHVEGAIIGIIPQSELWIVIKSRKLEGIAIVFPKRVSCFRNGYQLPV